MDLVSNLCIKPTFMTICVYNHDDNKFSKQVVEKKGLLLAKGRNTLSRKPLNLRFDLNLLSWFLTFFPFNS